MFNFSLFLFSTTLLFLITASFFDLKYRIIPNRLIFFILIIGVVTKITQAIVLSEVNIFLNAFLSFIITVFVCYILWEIGLFAGGDLKLFSAVSFLNPFNLNFLNFFYNFGIISQPIFSLTLIITSIISTAPLLIIQSLYLFVFRGHHFVLWDIYKSKNTFSSFINSVLTLFFLTSFLNLFSLSVPYLFFLIFSLFFILFFRKLEKKNKLHFYYFISFLYMLLIVYSLIFGVKVFNFLDLLTIIIIIKLLFFFVTIYRIISEKILVDKKPLSSLKEGDVTLNNYYKVGYKVIEKKVNFINYFKQIINNSYSKNLIIDSRKVGGLREEDITFLKSSYKHNLDKEILLKKTIPFTPSVLIAYLLLNIFGDFIWLFF